MVWVILAVLVVPLWLCATAFALLAVRDRRLGRRPGSLPVRVRRADARRWSRGHAVWAHDVFAFRGLPAGWREELVWVADAHLRAPSEQEREDWRLGDAPMVAVLRPAEAMAPPIEVAARGEHQHLLLGPFMDAGATAGGAGPGREERTRR